ncbi:hypothetical protein QJS04_geneDACA005896 [Acorus gramineus]|uniref:Sororin C-terminal region domain-containing protein n=1 Tax=Acorus gramineus TaxID=55184 RepID=A0AAV9B6E9_ACOGR|nr:hypothetical protein QJS04_geneDACA005896 [Acorus gramineus]
MSCIAPAPLYHLDFHLIYVQKRRYMVPGGVEKHKLSQDFIDKQRAYFMEIDDFELQVEAVSEGEME